MALAKALGILQLAGEGKSVFLFLRGKPNVTDSLPCGRNHAFHGAKDNIYYIGTQMVLYVKGQLGPKDKNAVAMVGSRQTTHYGLEVARKLAYQLAYVGVTVVSGGARGIDTAAHQGALNSKRRTVAVLGTHTDITLPPDSAEPFARIP